MADNHSKEIRSKNMSHIRSTNTKPEECVRKYLFSRGLRYRKNVRKLPGCPDIVLKKYKTVVFINGCFWHHHDCGRFVWPSSNEEYWHNKIDRNVERDKESQKKLEAQGWQVLVIWECQLKKLLQRKICSSSMKKSSLQIQKMPELSQQAVPAFYYSSILASIDG